MRVSGRIRVLTLVASFCLNKLHLKVVKHLSGSHILIKYFKNFVIGV